MADALRLYNGSAAPMADLPLWTWTAFAARLAAVPRDGASLSTLFALPEPDGSHRLIAILTVPSDGGLDAFSTRVEKTFPSLTPVCPAVHLFERELYETHGLVPEGHPWLKPVRFPPGAERPAIGEAGFFRMDGDEAHEVAVGPVHAGVIEPGHFRFQCHGEDVHHLEISLGYQHRGVARALRGGPDRRTLHYMETLAGDTTVGHASACVRNVEAMAGVTAPPRASALRAIATELERLANHVGDLGALANDVAFLPTSSYNGRLRGDLLNLTALACGNRFGRGWLRPGGVAFDLEPARADEMKRRLREIEADVRRSVALLWDTPSVVARFEDTGRVDAADARAIGLVGPAARACGLERDVRSDLPYGLYMFAHIPPASWTSGDVFARAMVRAVEIERSFDFLRDALDSLPAGETATPVGPPAPDRIAVSLSEGWRGEICHAAVTDGRGRFRDYHVVDPSFRNWFGLALALRGQPISDFPLCNKSFNLSYCGFDL